MGHACIFLDMGYRCVRFVSVDSFGVIGYSKLVNGQLSNNNNSMYSDKLPRKCPEGTHTSSEFEPLISFLGAFSG